MSPCGEGGSSSTGAAIGAEGGGSPWGEPVARAQTDRIGAVREVPERNTALWQAPTPLVPSRPPPPPATHPPTPCSTPTLIRTRAPRTLALPPAASHAPAAAPLPPPHAQGAAQSGARLEGGGSVLVLPACAAGYKLYVLATLAVSLAMYALSPRLVML